MKKNFETYIEVGNEPGNISPELAEMLQRIGIYSIAGRFLAVILDLVLTKWPEIVESSSHFSVEESIYIQTQLHSLLKPEKKKKEELDKPLIDTALHAQLEGKFILEGNDVGMVKHHIMYGLGRLDLPTFFHSEYLATAIDALTVAKTTPRQLNVQLTADSRVQLRRALLELSELDNPREYLDREFFPMYDDLTPFHDKYVQLGDEPGKIAVRIAKQLQRSAGLPKSKVNLMRDGFPAWELAGLSPRFIVTTRNLNEKALQSIKLALEMVVAAQ